MEKGIQMALGIRLPVNKKYTFIVLIPQYLSLPLMTASINFFWSRGAGDETQGLELAR